MARRTRRVRSSPIAIFAVFVVAVIVAVLRAFTAQGVRTGNDMHIVDAGPELRRALHRIAGAADKETP